MGISWSPLLIDFMSKGLSLFARRLALSALDIEWLNLYADALLQTNRLRLKWLVLCSRINTFKSGLEAEYFKVQQRHFLFIRGSLMQYSDEILAKAKQIKLVI